MSLDLSLQAVATENAGDRVVYLVGDKQLAIFDCDDAGLMRVLKRMCEIIKDNDGRIHKNLRIVARKGVLSIEAPFMPKSGKPLISIPSNLLLPIADFNMELSGDEIGLISYATSISGEQCELMSLMLEIFNRTGKIAQYRSASPFISCEGEETLFAYLTASRLDGSEREVMNELKNEDAGSFLLRQFFKTRTLDYKYTPKDEKAIKVLMPIVDCINHHPMCMPVSGIVGKNGLADVAVFRGVPIPGSAECFVRYGIYDVIELLLKYQYVDCNVNFARSISLEINLPGLGDLNISSGTTPLGEEFTPEQLRDIWAFFPPFKIDQRERRIDAGFLIIPTENAPLSLRRILSYMIRKSQPDLCQEDMKYQVIRAERGILRHNIDHYQNLLSYLDRCRVTLMQENYLEMARAAVELQLKNIKKYPFC